VTRAFVAIVPPEAVLDAVAARTSTVSLPDARFAPRAQWHVTVQFLGNHVDIDAVSAALEGLRATPAEVQLGGAGPVGGTKQRGTVFALGVRPWEWLNDLVDAVGERLAPLGHEPENRRYLPHLTLARCKRRTDMREAAAAVGPEPVGEPWLVDRVVLFESETRREGAVHTKVAEILLRS
jgi:2'-5' RNA ligase